MTTGNLCNSLIAAPAFEILNISVYKDQLLSKNCNLV